MHLHVSNLPLTGNPDRSARAEHGFTLVEVLIVAVLVLIVLLSLVPLFSQSMMSNLEGWIATEGISFGRSELETRTAISLERAEMVVESADIQTVVDRTWNGAERKWVVAADAPDQVIWQRTTRVRQYSISDLVGPPGEEKRFDNPLSGDYDPRYIHLREINVWVEHQKAVDALQGANRGLDVTVMRAY